MITRKVGDGPIETHMSIDEAARRMRAHFESMDAERRSYVMDYFIEHCQGVGMALSPEFIEAFERASAPWKVGS